MQERTSSPPLIECENVPREAKKLIRASTEDVYGIKIPRDFQYSGVYHCISNDNTVLAIPRRTSDGKTLVVQLASFFRELVFLP